MMKKIYLFAIASIAFVNLMAQARNTTTEYQKVMRPAIVSDMPFPEKVVNGAIEDKLGKMGYKGKSTKGFTLYSGVRVPEIGAGTYDLYFLVDRVSKKDKDNSTVTLMVSKGFDNFVSDTSDVSAFNNAKTYLNSLRDVTAAYDLELQIADQEDAIKKADKKYNNLVDEATDLQKKKRKLEDQIAENIAAQAAQKTESEKQKQILETLRGKRKQ